MATILQTNQLTKHYGRHRGIIDVTCEIQEGEGGMSISTSPNREVCGKYVPASWKRRRSNGKLK